MTMKKLNEDLYKNKSNSLIKSNSVENIKKDSRLNKIFELSNEEDDIILKLLILNLYL